MITEVDFSDDPGRKIRSNALKLLLDLTTFDANIAGIRLFIFENVIDIKFLQHSLQLGVKESSIYAGIYYFYGVKSRKCNFLSQIHQFSD